jgi:transcriptional regulator GlxA family with amidase domain
MPRIPPSDRLLPAIAAAEAPEEDIEFEEAALRVAGVAMVAQDGVTGIVPGPRHEHRITEIFRRIEVEPEEPVTLAGLARQAAVSPYHFLRTFCAVSGVTPINSSSHSA